MLLMKTSPLNYHVSLFDKRYNELEVRLKGGEGGRGGAGGGLILLVNFLSE